MFRANSGSGYKLFSQRRIYLSPVTVEAIQLIKTSIKLLPVVANCVVNVSLLRHKYPAVAHILTSSVKLALRSISGFKNKCWAMAGFEPQNARHVYNSVSVH